MNIDKVEIKNFRNYVGEHYFDFKKNITVFYGDNGFGKSSFFDALEWGLTGTISRFSDESDNERLKKDIINRYELVQEEEIECSVSIIFNGNKLTRKFIVSNGVFKNVSVRITDKNNKTLRNEDDKLINSKEKVDEYLSGSLQGGLKGKKNVFGKLMKQTYILSQDQVTDFISSEDPVETFRSIASIMGFRGLLNLSDNISKVYLGLNSNYTKSKEDIELIDNTIISKQETKREVDTVNLASEMQILSIDMNKEDVDLTFLENLRNETISTSIKQRELLDISKVNNEDYLDLSSMNDTYQRLLELQSTANNKTKKYKDLSVSLKERIKNLQSIISQVDIFNEHMEKTKVFSQNLKALNPKSEDVEVIQKEIDDKMELKLKYQYLIVIFKNYNENKQINENSPQKILKLKSKLELFKSLKRKRKDTISKIDNEIVKDESGILVNLLSNVKGLFEYIQHNHHGDQCPVCSSIIEEGLESAVGENLKKYNDEVTTTSAYAGKSLKVKSALTRNVEQLDSMIKKIDLEILQITQSQETANENIKKTHENSLFDATLMSQDLRLLNELNQKNELSLKNLNEVMDLILELNKLKSKNEFIVMGQSLTTTDESISTRIDRLNRALNRIILRINYYDAEIVALGIKIKLLDKNMQEFISTASKISINSEAPFKDIIADIIQGIANMEKRVELISNVERAYDVIRNNTFIQKQIEEHQEERFNLNLNVNKLKKKLDALSQYISSVFGDFGDSAKDYLNDYNSPIQKYFRYLNPLPTRSTVRFEGEGENLFVKVIFDEIEEENNVTSPKNVLSSGQMNVLAISIFLAMNESQKIHDLDFIAIDDPIQNMDDVNQFSICDVLGSLKKQLIFSTHDFEFVKLFIKKNEHQKENIQVYNFKSPYLTPDRIEHITFT
ncbi:SMC family ATPase [Peribacillus frigoritolerans]|uniref:AAA family ATPase n=1 Tax=Peribacillus frigoritolerans TaxID=450367 RepID=UPI002E22034C|nr:SMC family ATPase [Peribacillus frigoritolerans]